MNKEVLGKVTARRERAKTGTQPQLSKVPRTVCFEISTKKPGVKEFETCKVIKTLQEKKKGENNVTVSLRDRLPQIHYNPKAVIYCQ